MWILETALRSEIVQLESNPVYVSNIQLQSCYQELRFKNREIRVKPFEISASYTNPHQYESNE